MCDLLDFRCIFVNELAGNPVFAALLSVILYFIIASKLKLGFDTTIGFAIPTFIIFGLMITGFSVIYAFATVFVSLILAWVFQEIIRNR